MLTCKQASKLVSASQERRLSLRERLGLRWHLWMCGNCRRFERQILGLREALRRAWRQGELPLHRDLPAAARARIRQAVRERADRNGQAGRD